ARPLKSNPKENVERGGDVHGGADAQLPHLPLIVGVLTWAGARLLSKASQPDPIRWTEDEAQKLPAGVFQRRIFVDREHLFRIDAEGSGIVNEPSSRDSGSRRAPKNNLARGDLTSCLRRAQRFGHPESVANAVVDSHAPIGIARQEQARQIAQRLIDSPQPRLVADVVLGNSARPLHDVSEAGGSVYPKRVLQLGPCQLFEPFIIELGDLRIAGSAHQTGK